MSRRGLGEGTDQTTGLPGSQKGPSEVWDRAFERSPGRMTVRLSPHGRLGVEVGSTPTRLGYVRNRAWVSPLHSGHGNWALGQRVICHPCPFFSPRRVRPGRCAPGDQPLSPWLFGCLDSVPPFSHLLGGRWTEHSLARCSLSGWPLRKPISVGSLVPAPGDGFVAVMCSC